MTGVTADAFANRRWSDVHRALAEHDDADLSVEDLRRIAVAAYLVGQDDDAVGAWDRAHRSHLDRGERAEAAECAFWAAFCSMMRGQMAHAGGWLARCETVLGDDDQAPARGYLLIPGLLRALDAGDAAAAEQMALRARELAEASADPDLGAFATLGHGQALLAQGDGAAGLRRLDEVMLAVSGGEVGPIVTGIVYCAVILECMQLFDLGRAAEWTTALDRWCAGQPDLVPYRGQCLVHQSQLRQYSGDWVSAQSTAADACRRLSDPRHPALGLACYQEGELHRLRGEGAAAAAAYERARDAGYDPVPGSLLLMLDGGDVTAAVAGIRRALGEAGHPFQRPGRLAAAVEIHLAASDLDAARQAADELDALALRSGAAALRAMAAMATGATLLAAGRHAKALTHLRDAATGWSQLSMPYEAARTSVLLARACAAAGDEMAAAAALTRAVETFQRLGAEPDLRRSGELRSAGAGEVLSARELEVLRLVAAGDTTEQIASALVISPHTVRRHLENVFAKIGVNTRAAAVAHAYEHEWL